MASFITRVPFYEYEASLAQWVRSLGKGGKNHFHASFGFKCMFGWHSLSVDWGMLKAASRFWTSSSHLFNFSYNEMCPTHEEFCAMVGMPEGGKIVVPNFLRSPLVTLHQTLGLELAEIKKMIHADLLDITLLPAMFSGRHSSDQEYQERRMFALALCLFAKYFFASKDGFVDMRVVDVVSQIHHKKSNALPIILGETLHGFDHFCSGENHPFNRGSPLLLHMWLQEHFCCVSPFVGNIYEPSAYSCRSLKDSSQREEKSWLTMFSSCSSDDIEWMPPHWRLKRFMIYSTSQSYVLLPGLRRSSFYFGDRITRQFGRAQRIPCSDLSPPKEEDMDGPLAQRIFGAWNCSLGDRTIMAGDPPESYYLNKEYLEWLIPKVELEYFEILATLSALIGETPAHGARERLHETNAVMDFPDMGGYFPPREPDPMEAYFAQAPRVRPDSCDDIGPSDSVKRKGKMKRGDDDECAKPKKSVFSRLGRK